MKRPPPKIQEGPGPLSDLPDITMSSGSEATPQRRPPVHPNLRSLRLRVLDVSGHLDPDRTYDYSHGTPASPTGRAYSTDSDPQIERVEWPDSPVLGVTTRSRKAKKLASSDSDTATPARAARPDRHQLSPPRAQPRAEPSVLVSPPPVTRVVDLGDSSQSTIIWQPVSAKSPPKQTAPKKKSPKKTKKTKKASPTSSHASGRLNVSMASIKSVKRGDARPHRSPGVPNDPAVRRGNWTSRWREFRREFGYGPLLSMHGANWRRRLHGQSQPVKKKPKEDDPDWLQEYRKKKRQRRARERRQEERKQRQLEKQVAGDKSKIVTKAQVSLNKHTLHRYVSDSYTHTLPI